MISEDLIEGSSYPARWCGANNVWIADVEIEGEHEGDQE
jgi:hypothetical protein